MMVYVDTASDGYLHHGGAFFVFSMLISGGYLAESQRFFGLIEPRGSAHATSFSLSESVIVGNILPSEVFASQTTI